MQVAASQLGVSMTTLKKLCRENNLDRWPFRKRKSLSQMTVRTKQALTDSEETDKVQIQAALDVLEHQQQRMRVSSAGTACTFLHLILCLFLVQTIQLLECPDWHMMVYLAAPLFAGQD